MFLIDFIERQLIKFIKKFIFIYLPLMVFFFIELDSKVFVRDSLHNKADSSEQLLLVSFVVLFGKFVFNWFSLLLNYLYY